MFCFPTFLFKQTNYVLLKNWPLKLSLCLYSSMKTETGLHWWPYICLYVHYETHSIWLCFPYDGGNGGLDGGWWWWLTTVNQDSRMRMRMRMSDCWQQSLILILILILETWLTVGSPVHSYPSPHTVFRYQGENKVSFTR